MLASMVSVVIPLSFEYDEILTLGDGASDEPQHPIRHGYDESLLLSSMYCK
jgi:hypothetical protein